MKKVALPGRGFYKIKYDHYQKSRGAPLIIDIYCNSCNNLLFVYQKDGPGPLLRSYLDRIAWPEYFPKLSLTKPDFKDLKNINCPNCKLLIATPMIYEKENRLAYNMIQEAFIEKVRK